jgi:2-polyprenyl-6-methoxyphenol hydroxylase-like FAD-dependent oxidoreductase
VRVVVMGGGVSGLATALALGREGHDVVVLERDATQPTRGGPDEICDERDRPGIAQFRQPHNVLGLGRRVLRARFPDVYRAILAAGAVEVEQSRFIPAGARQPGDEELATIACRRPVLDDLLARALEDEPTVHRRQGAKVTGLEFSPGGSGRVIGAVLDGAEQVRGDLVVDCLGRTTRVPGWISDHGLVPPAEQTSDCGLIYYSRHFRVRDGAEMPPYASLLGGPRGDLGYLAFATFLGDNRTFCLCIMTSSADRELRAVRSSEAFMRVAERLPGMLRWVDPASAQAITPVLPMGRLHNVVRRYVCEGRPVAPGLWPVGDALSHTNPTFAFGVSLALHHAVTLADALNGADDEESLTVRLDMEMGEDATRRYEAVTAEDRDRCRLWAGAPIDVSDRTATMPLFLRAVVYRVAPEDPSLLRAVARRIGLFADPHALAADDALLDRAEEIFRDMKKSGAIAAGPSRQELLAAIAG